MNLIKKINTSLVSKPISVNRPTVGLWGLRTRPNGTNWNQQRKGVSLLMRKPHHALLIWMESHRT